MSHDVALSCACGSVRGTGHGLSSRTGMRFVCYCMDCQTYAHHLGRPESVLDGAGGTEVFQTTPRRVTIDKGHAHLKCLRQGPKGALRWYAACCGTPVANGTMNPRFPFAALVHAFMPFPSKEERDRVLGPVRGALLTDTATGTPPHALAGRLTLAQAAARIGMAFLRGHHRPTPFFEGGGSPVSKPQLMDLERRNELRARVKGASELRG